MSKNDLPDEIKALQAGIKLGLAASPKPEPEIRGGSLFNTGIRPAIDEYLAKKGAEIRDYGDYWSASSAGYCMRKLIFERLGVPPVEKDSDARRTRVFEAGHVFHAWVQEITKNAGLSVAQELELSDDGLMVRGHIDDLVLIKTDTPPELDYALDTAPNPPISPFVEEVKRRLILYDYKTQHANAFTWQKGRPPSYFHRLQVGTYMYMLRKSKLGFGQDNTEAKDLSEARVLKISKDDLRLDENQILWDDELQAEVLLYWGTLNSWWKDKKIPPCSCADKEGGFMSKEKFNPYWYDGEPCSLAYYQQWNLTKKET